LREDIKGTLVVVMEILGGNDSDCEDFRIADLSQAMVLVIEIEHNIVSNDVNRYNEKVVHVILRLC
jgi:hypothetical protein